MRRATCVCAAVACLIAIACDGGTAPLLPLRSETIDVQPVVLATAEDAGPQDGEFDVFWNEPNLGMVDNNGFVNLRTTLEYQLPVLPADAAIVAITLRLPVLIGEGPRSLQIHGYAANGTAQLADFALNQVLATFVVSGNQNFVIDVKAFVELHRANNTLFVGFNVREEPANIQNFTIMHVRVQPPPLLRVEYTTRE